MIFNFMKAQKMAFFFSGVLITLSLLSIFVFKGFVLGLDFLGGSVIEIHSKTPIHIPTLQNIIQTNTNFSKSVITQFGTPENVVIKTPANQFSDQIGTICRETLKSNPEYEIRRVDMAGAKVGDELQNKGILALGLSLFFILLYVAFRFEISFSIASVLALFHDIIITLGAISFFEVEVNLDVVAALLTILGYSLNDTIIIFDRIRQELFKVSHTTTITLLNLSINITLTRTLITALTTFFSVLGLYIFGGEALYSFSSTLLVGIIIGTYSSIYIASSLLDSLGFSITKWNDKNFQKKLNKENREKNLGETNDVITLW